MHQVLKPTGTTGCWQHPGGEDGVTHWPPAHSRVGCKVGTWGVRFLHAFALGLGEAGSAASPRLSLREAWQV